MHHASLLFLFPTHRSKTIIYVSPRLQHAARALGGGGLRRRRAAKTADAPFSHNRLMNAHSTIQNREEAEEKKTLKTYAKNNHPHHRLFTI